MQNSRNIELPDDVWHVVDAISRLHGTDDSETIANFIRAATSGDNFQINFEDAVQTGGGDIVGGNVDRSQGKVLCDNTTISGDLKVTSTNKIYCNSLTIRVGDEKSYELISNGEPIQQILARVDSKPRT